ncbi:MAG: O-antigen ligase family protein [Flavobacteriales bacterium]
MRTTDPFRSIHVTALALCATFLPWSTAFLSMAQMLLAANWLVEGLVRRDLGARFKRSLTSGPVLVFLSFFVLHVLGLLWSEDLGWGADLGRILFPVLVFGVILGGSDRLARNELRVILLLGAWSAVACSLFGLVFSGAVDGDYRTISMFISHIRLALLLCLAIVVFIHYRHGAWWVPIIHGAAVLWALYALNKLGSIQAFIILLLIALAALWRSAARLGPAWRRVVRMILCGVPMLVIVWGALEVRHRYRLPPADLPARMLLTAGGEPYAHDVLNPQTENGTFVWTYIAWRELRRTWLLRSDRSLDSLDAKGHPLWSTAVRYLASKGLHKDSIGVMALNESDVEAIERGVPNVLQGHRHKLRERFEEVLFELQVYHTTGNANGHSVAMRLEFWKTGLAIARDNWMTGVGTGDTQRAFDRAYEERKSTLLPQWRLRAHNEYITLLISFGVLGLLWSLFTWWWPAWKLGAWRDPLFIAWAIIFGVSCLTDDTVETQAGATFFALYYAVFVFAAPLSAALRAGPAHGADRSA